MNPSAAVAGPLDRSARPPAEPRVPASRRQAVRRAVEAAAADLDPDAVLLSGGPDSSVAAAAAAGLWTQAFCVATPEGPDPPYAAAAADALGLRLEVVTVGLADVLDRIPDVADALRTFDPMELRNAAVQWIALEAAADAGASTVLTGDGADELFAGYSFMARMDPTDLDAYRERLRETMSFAAPRMAPAHGLEARSPFLGEAVREASADLDHRDLVGEHADRTWGKWVLREAFRDVLPAPVLWRRKDPLEVGAGTDQLPRRLSAATPEDELEAARESAAADGVAIRDAEHLAYYRAYRETHPPPRDLDPDVRRRCPGCQGPLPGQREHCSTCGWDASRHAGQPRGDDAGL